MTTTIKVDNPELIKVLNDVGADRVMWVYERFMADREKRYAYNKRRNAEAKLALAFAKSHPDFKT